VVFGALGVELGPLGRALDAKKVRLDPDLSIRKADRAGWEIYLVTTGVGFRALPAATRALSVLAPKASISTGTAGGLDPDLSTGQGAAAPRVLQGPEAIEADPELLKQSRAVFPDLVLRPFVTVKDAVATPKDKARLRASSGAGLCEMESFLVAQACLEASVPCLALRIVSDTSADTLPCFEKFVRHGILDKIRMMEHFALHPNEARLFADISRKTLVASKKIPGYLLELIDRLGRG
jgi:nucleoside phosphorylase